MRFSLYAHFCLIWFVHRNPAVWKDGPFRRQEKTGSIERVSWARHTEPDVVQTCGRLEWLHSQGRRLCSRLSGVVCCRGVVSGGILFERNTAIQILIVNVQAVLFWVAVLELKEVEHIILECELIVLIWAFLVIAFFEVWLDAWIWFNLIMRQSIVSVMGGLIELRLIAWCPNMQIRLLLLLFNVIIEWEWAHFRISLR